LFSKREGERMFESNPQAISLSSCSGPGSPKKDFPAHAERVAERRRALAAALDQILPGGDSVVFEVGSGHGHFLAAYAQAHAAQTCIGIDIASDRVERATRKRDRAGLKNLHFLRAEARLFLDVLPAAVRLADVYILFPDPWPKLRHHKHRILQAPFLTQLADRMGEGARLFFRTDYHPYFADAQGAVREHARWRLVEENWPFEHETVFQSRAAQYHSFVARRRAV
jgi:tRNA (guanine-N7-)-methyltransferase